ncbi:MAG TPA: hypothetical protein VFJ81_15570 [Gemmatimonadales bacterium]|nr:hypothetical protein [Gemmatimonadales bacterium]
MRLHSLLSTVAGGFLVAALYACGAPDAKPDAASQDTAAADAATADTTPAAAPADPAQQPLTVADIDRWDKGMAAELEAVHAAAEKRRTAKTADDTVTAMMALQDMATLETGAKAAGVDGERYNLIRSTFSEAASYLAPSVGGLDTTGLSPDQLAVTKVGNAAQLEQMKDRVPADVLSALTARAAELRKKDLELVAARIKGAGM